MCGRMKDYRDWSEYQRLMNEASIPIKQPGPEAAPNLEIRAEIRPTDDAVILRPTEGGTELLLARWWLVPWFHKGALKEWKATTFNARADTIETSRAFRDSFQRRRCLVGANGWWEWKDEGGKRKQRYWIEPRDKEPIMFAGIWDRCDTIDKGPVESFAVVTQGPGMLCDVHDRAPVVLYHDEWAQWMDLDADVGVLLAREPLDRFAVTPVESNV
jgi:putative SOS response-associated peptidase YedK